jgi:hypothetical protein
MDMENELILSYGENNNERDGQHMNLWKMGLGWKWCNDTLNKDPKMRGKNGKRMKIRQFAEFLRKDGGSEKSSGSHNFFSLSSISLLSQTEEIVYFYSLSLSLLFLSSLNHLYQTDPMCRRCRKKPYRF